MTAARQPLSKFFRTAISILILGHLLAVFLPPLSFQTRGPLGQSPSVATLLRPVEAYGQFLYIDRGYAFFAPDPGPSHLVQAAVTRGDGQMTETMYPDLQNQWPRLLYHRHFMLTEFLEEIYRPPGPPAELVELDREEAELWVRTRARYEHVRQSVVEHLKHENPGTEVAIRRIEHLIPEVIAYQQDPIELTDPRLYRVLLDLPIDLQEDGDLAAPVGPPETIPPPVGAALEREAMTIREDAAAPTVDDDTAEETASAATDPASATVATPSDDLSDEKIDEKIDEGDNVDARADVESNEASKDQGSERGPAADGESADGEASDSEAADGEHGQSESPTEGAEEIEDSPVPNDDVADRS